MPDPDPLQLAGSDQAERLALRDAEQPADRLSADQGLEQHRRTCIRHGESVGSVRCCVLPERIAPPPLSEDDAYIDWLEQWVHERERIKLLEVVALDLVRTQSLTISRTSLLHVIEQDPVTRRWRPIGNRITGAEVVQIWDAKDEANRREPSPHRPKLKCRPRDMPRPKGVPQPLNVTRARPLGVPYQTLESWIEELREDGFLKPSAGPGRPRRDTPKYELGPHFDR
jgi:hypothetical protein